MLGDDADFSGGPGAGPVDPTQPLLLLAQRLQEATSATFDDPEQFVDEVVQELLEMPPERRFEDGITVLEDHFVEEFGSIDAANARLPIASALLFAFIEQLLNQWADNIAERALHSNEQEQRALLIVLGVVDVMQSSMEGLRAGMQSDDDDIESLALSRDGKYQLGSVLIASYARLYRELKREQSGGNPSIDALAEDVFHGERTVTHVFEPSYNYPDIDELTDDELAWIAIRRGALRAYMDVDISVGRGAELAGMTQNQFVEFLEANGVHPGYGPESVDELYSGPDLTDE